MSESDVVTVRGLRKVYGDRVVVDGLDLDVPAGQVVGLIGANGAGKTTTVECSRDCGGLMAGRCGSWPEAGRGEMRSGLRALAGVRAVSCAGGRVTVHGQRQIIAQVGAELVRRGRIPDDLTVEIPNLQSALLGLLGRPDGASASAAPPARCSR